MTLSFSELYLRRNPTCHPVPAISLAADSTACTLLETLDRHIPVELLMFFAALRKR